MAREVVTREQWQEARQALLADEKVHTRERAALADRRRALPSVRVEEDYLFTTPDGERHLGDLFAGVSQLLVYHLMFGPGWDQPSVGCSQWADAMNGTSHHFDDADACLIAVSRTTIAEKGAIARARDWRFDWYSSFGSAFNYDYLASSEDTGADSSKRAGGDFVQFDRGENHGVSVFERDESGEIFHRYSVYSRGIEAMNGAFGYYDLLPKGCPW